MPLPKTTQPPARIQIQAIEPIVDCGRYAVKRTVGDRVDVYATIFKDGHDTLAGAVRVRGPGERNWARGAAERLRQRPLGRLVHRRPSRPVGVRRHRVDRSHRDVAGGDPPQGRSGRDRARGRAVRGCGAARPRFRHRRRRRSPRRRATARASSPRRRSRSTSTACSRASARGTSSSRARGAASAAWRRCCRSSRSSASTSSTCRPCIRSGTRTARGRTTRSRPGRAIRARRGRSARRRAVTTRSIPDLGTWDDFDAMVAAAKAAGVELALDFAVQCSPDHPWLKQHPEWFYRRPDGTLKYAENPPKKYQDIYNVNFDSEDWRAPLAGAPRRRARLGRARDHRLPRRQPAHEADRVLGVADPRGARVASRGDLPRRGVHAARRDDDAREARLRAVVHLLHVEELEGGARASTCSSSSRGRSSTGRTRS